jgi:copper resistance protein B
MSAVRPLATVLLLLAAPAHAADPHAQHVAAATDDPHAQHVQHAAKPDPHAQHAQHAAAASEDPHAHHAMKPAAEPRTPVPVPTAADRAAAFPDVARHPAHDRTVHAYWLFDKLEARDGGGGAWETEAWVGGDVNRLWIRTEGEGDSHGVEHASIELLGGHGVSAWWDVVAGVRHDTGDAPSQTLLAVGVQGLAPYKIEVEATAYLAGDGQAGVHLEAGYETLLSSRWVVQWEATAEAWAREDARRDRDAGLATVTLGARLRYERSRRVQPYVGVEFAQAFGGTADAWRARDGDANDARLVAGVRFWF